MTGRKEIRDVNRDIAYCGQICSDPFEKSMMITDFISDNFFALYILAWLEEERLLLTTLHTTKGTYTLRKQYS